jgi:hypothetical protein
MNTIIIEEEKLVAKEIEIAKIDANLKILEVVSQL